MGRDVGQERDFQRSHLNWVVWRHVHRLDVRQHSIHHLKELLVRAGASAVVAKDHASLLLQKLVEDFDLLLGEFDASLAR